MYRLLVVIAFVGSAAWLITSPGFEPAIACVAASAAIFRDEFHAIVGARVLSLTPRNAPIRNAAHTRFSFCRSEFVSPLIVADLCGWISDVGDQVVAVNVTASNESNRYFGAIDTSLTDKHPVVSAQSGEHRFSYQYLGCSFSGVHLLRTWSSSGGGGVFGSILLVTISTDVGIEVEPHGTAGVDRFIIKKIGDIPLGDRYEGNVKYVLGLLSIGACAGAKSLRKQSQRLVIL
jgi:hypothetical protein